MSRNLVLLAGFILFFFHLAQASVPDWSREAKAQVSLSRDLKANHLIGCANETSKADRVLDVDRQFGL